MNVKASRGGASASKAVQPEKCVCAMCKFSKRKMGNFFQTQWCKGGGRKCNNCINSSVLNPQKSIPLQSSVTTVKSPAKAEKRRAADGVPGHHRGIKQKTATSEVELDDGTKIVETQTIESYADGTTVKRIKRILKKTADLPDGSQSVETTETNSTVKTSTAIIGPP